MSILKAACWSLRASMKRTVEGTSLKGSQVLPTKEQGMIWATDWQTWCSPSSPLSRCSQHGCMAQTSLLIRLLVDIGPNPWRLRRGGRYLQFIPLEGKRKKTTDIQAQNSQSPPATSTVKKTKNSQTNHSLMKESKSVIRIKSPGRVGVEGNDCSKCILNNFARSDS